MHNQYLAPTEDLDNHRARLREAFGNTMSDEFVDVMLGKLMEALKPNPFDQLEEATLNAALAIIHSLQCRSEWEAFSAVQIVATGFAGLRFLRQSQHSMTDDYIRTYGPYADKLLRLHLDLIHALDRHRRGHKQTVEVHHLHVHSGGNDTSSACSGLRLNLREHLHMARVHGRGRCEQCGVSSRSADQSNHKRTMNAQAVKRFWPKHNQNDTEIILIFYRLCILQNEAKSYCLKSRD